MNELNTGGMVSDLRVFRGTLVHSTDSSPLEILPDRAVGVRHGVIVFIEKGFILPEIQVEQGIKDEHVYHLKEGWFMLPGFVDAHINAGQYPFLGAGTDVKPLDWQARYRQAALVRLHKEQLAKEAFQKLVTRTLRNGTTTAAYNGTDILSAAKILCDTIDTKRQRALVGLGIYIGIHQIDFHESQIELAQDLVKYICNKGNRLLSPCLDMQWLLPIDLEEKLVEIQKKYDNISIKTTLGELPRTLEMIKHRDWIDFERTPTQHLWRGDILNSKAILLHCIHCTDEDYDLIQKKNAGIVHCPNSNTSMINGTLDVRKLQEKGIKVALGTDASAGYSISMLDAMRQCVQSSKMLKLSKPAHFKNISTREAFMMATLGGAKVLGLEKEIGNFQVGKEFDALMIDPDVEDGPFDIFLDTDNAEDIVEKFLNLGDDRNIREVYVSGERVQ